MDRFFARLGEFLPDSQIFRNEPMCYHTSFRVGGSADFFVAPATLDELAAVVDLCIGESVDYYVIGNGSNIIVKDNGFRGVIIHVGSLLSAVSLCGDGVINAQAGVLLSSLASFACNHSLSGLEFAHGIPGSLGGAVCMNAGAYDGEMSLVVNDVTVLAPDGRFLVLNREQLMFSYRSSVIQRDGFIVTSASLSLSGGYVNDIREKMQLLNSKRVSKQPLNLPSAGSTFKRPDGFFAGKLIMESGLAGFSIGGAMVSPKHCGFIVNSGDACATDILRLIDVITDTVYTAFGVRLVPEVKIIGV